VRGGVLAVVIDDRDRHVAAHGDEIAARDLCNVAVADDDLAFRAGLEERAVDHLRRTTDVERTHRQRGAPPAGPPPQNDADALPAI